MISFNKIQRQNIQTGSKAWYPNLVINGTATADDVIKGIVEKCTLTKVDVKAVLIALEEVVIEQLLAGNSVRFGDLGSFRPSLHSRKYDADTKTYGTGGMEVATTTYNTDGSVKAQGVTADNIAGIGVVFTKSSEMKKKIARQNLTFKQVAGEIAMKTA